MDEERKREEAQRVYADTGVKEYAPGEWSMAVKSLNKQLAKQPDAGSESSEVVDSTQEEEKEGDENSLLIPYERFILNVDGYLTGYLYAKQEYEKLEAERKPSIILKKDYQDGFPHVRWEKLKTQTVKMSVAFRGFRERAVSEQPELKELFDQFDEANKKA